VSSRCAWLFDIGSTFTKLTVVDLDDPARRWRAQAPTTVATNVREGFFAAVESLHAQGGPPFETAAFRGACSSAAGGLALIVSGLVPRLSAEAGRIAALGAGAKLVGTLSWRLTADDVDHLRELAPDVVLLTGGTDGGDRATLLANAEALAGWDGCPAVVVAGNREVAPTAAGLLQSAGVRAVAVANILPDLDRLEPEPAREAIRDEFLSNIVHAKGIDRVREHLDTDILPTPGVVLDGVRLLAERAFPGGVLAVEVGGATTNVHSWAPVEPELGVITRGLPEPELKRTVEGDLGVRWNAQTILELAGPRLDEPGLAAYVDAVAAAPSTLPASEDERRFDGLLAMFAASTAIRRHCGRRREVMLPEGPVLVQEGKDLRHVEAILGTGGSVVTAEDPHAILSAALAPDDPFALVPCESEYRIDTDYALYATGLLAAEHPDAAVELALRSFDTAAERMERITA
jgi:uncharacterized protein (TIGR01319 family)